MAINKDGRAISWTDRIESLQRNSMEDLLIKLNWGSVILSEEEWKKWKGHPFTIGRKVTIEITPTSFEDKKVEV